MKRILIIVFAVLVFSPLNAGIKIAYNYFDVTNADAGFRVYTDSIYGARGDALRKGGVVSTLDFNQSFTSYNPACLAFQNTPVASFSGIPFEFVSSGFAGFIMNHDYGADFKKALEESIGNMASTTAQVLNPDLYVAQANGISGMEGMLPFADKNAAIGVAREEKLGIELNLLGEGIKANLDIHDPANPFFNMNMTATAGLAGNINLKTMVTSIGLGRKITPQWGVGAVVEYTDTRLSVGANAGAQVTAIDLATGTMFEYNTNTSNSFAQSLTGELDAAAWAIRVGTAFHAPDDAAEIAVEFSIQPEFTFGGSITGETHTLPKDSNTILDDYLDGRTTTIKTTYTTKDYDIKMKLPSYFRATLAWKPGAVLAFNYTYNFDAMSLRLDSADFSMLYEVQLQHSFRLGLNFEYFQIGGGVILEQERLRMENKTDSSGRSYTADNLIPVASMGWVIPMGTNVKTEWELAALPFPVCKASLTINY